MRKGTKKRLAILLLFSICSSLVTHAISTDHGCHTNEVLGSVVSSKIAAKVNPALQSSSGEFTQLKNVKSDPHSSPSHHCHIGCCAFLISDFNFQPQKSSAATYFLSRRFARLGIEYSDIRPPRT